MEGNFSRLFVLNREASVRCVLKIRAQWMTEARIRFEHALAGHLNNHGIPTVVPLAIQGSCSWAKVGGFYCEIAPFIDGREVRQSLDDIRLMGELLGRFHTCSRDIHVGLYEAPFFQNQIQPEELEPQLRQLCLQAEEMEDGSSEVVQGISARWKEIAACYKEHANSLPQVLRHGDFHPWNMLFRQSEPDHIAALFDLDMAAMGPRIYDFSYAIYMLRRLHPQATQEDWNTRFRRFTEAYGSAAATRFTEAEMAVVPFLIEMIALHFLVQRIVAEEVAAATAYQEYKSSVEQLDRMDSDWCIPHG